jgi:hypothetical protein
MKLVAIIENGVVASIVAVDDAGLVAALQSGGVVLPYAAPVQIGWRYNEQKFIAPTPQPLTSQQQRDAIQAQINAIEATQIMPRVTREALLALAVNEATAAGLTEPKLYAANIGYRKTKDADAAIVALRAQL